MKDIDNTVFLVDCSILQKMFEGSTKGNANEKKIMTMMKDINDRGGNLIVKTPTSHFLRALFLADPTKSTIQHVQKVLSFTKIMPSFADFKDGQACTEEMITIAKIMSDMGEKK